MPTLNAKIPSRESTLVRDKQVYEVYEEVLKELGDLAYEVSRAYIYERIRDRTKLSVRIISFIVNHYHSFKRMGK